MAGQPFDPFGEGDAGHVQHRERPNVVQPPVYAPVPPQRKKSVWEGLGMIHDIVRWCSTLCLLVCGLILSSLLIWIVYRVAIRAYEELDPIL